MLPWLNYPGYISGRWFVFEKFVVVWVWGLCAVLVVHAWSFLMCTFEPAVGPLQQFFSTVNQSLSVLTGSLWCYTQKAVRHTVVDANH